MDRLHDFEFLFKLHYQFDLSLYQSLKIIGLVVSNFCKFGVQKYKRTSHRVFRKYQITS